MADTAKVFFDSGPGDVVRSLEYWSKGEEYPDEMCVTYSGLFFDACNARHLKAYVISSNPRQADFVAGKITARNIPALQNSRHGALFHVTGVLNNFRRVILALRSDAKTIVIGPATHYFVFSLVRLAGRQLIFSLHNTITIPSDAPSAHARLLAQFDALCFRHVASGFVCASKKIEDQLQHLCGGKALTKVFLPLYREQRFAQIVPAEPLKDGPFRLLYIGRIEHDKGVFDLLDLCQRLLANGVGVTIDVCGKGSAQDDFSDSIKSQNLDATIRFHGFCSHSEILSRLNEADAVIVPTRAEFAEGFNMVVVEGILAGRPVIATNVCPANDYVADGIIEVQPGAIDEFVVATIKLARDRKLYALKESNARRLRSQFFNEMNSWKTAFTTLIDEIERLRLIK